MYTKDSFRKWLQQELNNRGWNQADLAAAANMSPSLISKILRGERNLGLDSTIAIAKALRLPVESLLKQQGIIQDISNTPELRELNHLFAQLSDRDKKEALVILRGYVHEKQQSYKPPTKDK